MKSNALKKILILLLSLTIASSPLFACADNNFDDNYTNLPEIIIGGDNYSPFFFPDDNGNFSGIDVELATEACRIMGYKPQFVYVDWVEKNKLLDSGKIDCLWSSFTMTDRENDYAWSKPYMNSRQVVAVAADSDIITLADLENKRVAVQSTTKPDEIFSGVTGKNLNVPKLKRLNCFSDVDHMFAAIREGYVDAIAGHETILIEYMKTSTVSLKILDEPLEEVQLGVAFKKDTHADVIERLNQALSLMQQNGFVAEVVEKYGLDPVKFVAV